MTTIIRDRNEVAIEKIGEIVTRARKGNGFCPYCGEKRTVGLYGIPASLIEDLKERAKSIY